MAQKHDGVSPNSEFEYPDEPGRMYAQPGADFVAARLMQHGSTVQHWRFLPASMTEAQRQQLARAEQAAPADEPEIGDQA